MQNIINRDMNYLQISQITPLRKANVYYLFKSKSS
jgi:hypothetical protein